MPDDYQDTFASLVRGAAPPTTPGATAGPGDPLRPAPLAPGRSPLSPLAGGGPPAPVDGFTPFTGPAPAPAAPATPAPFDPEHLPALHAAAGSLLAKTGNIDVARQIVDLAKGPGTPSPADRVVPGPAPASASADPAAAWMTAPYSGLHGGPSAYAAGREPSGIGFEDKRPMGFAPSGLDAPTQDLRTIALKEASGQRLSPAETSRLATRQGIESTPGAFGPGGPGGPATATAGNPRSILSTFAGAEAMRDPQRVQDSITDRLLRTQSADLAQREGAVRIADQTAQMRLREGTAAKDAQRETADAQQTAAYTAAVKAGAKTRQDLAAAGVTDAKLINTFPIDKEGGGFATYAEAAAALPPGSDGRIEQRADGKFYAGATTNARPSYPRDITVGKRMLTEVSPGKFMDKTSGQIVPWTNDVPKPVQQDAFYGSKTLTEKYGGDYAAYFIDAWNQAHAIQQQLDTQLQRGAATGKGNADLVPPPAADQPLAPADAAKLAPGTRFLGTDNIYHIRK